MESEGDGGSESEDDNDDGTKKFWQAVAQCKGSKVNPVRHPFTLYMMSSTYLSLTWTAQEEELRNTQSLSML